MPLPVPPDYSQASSAAPPLAAPDSRVGPIFLIFLRLGLTSFGGPVAHLGFFRTEFVSRRRWLSEQSYADLVALCQFLPGPASSQVGMALGMTRGGFKGALAAWLGFTLPSTLMLYVLAMSLSVWSQSMPFGVLHGLKIVAVAVVAQAVWGMGRSLCTSAARLAIAGLSTCLVLFLPTTAGQIGAMVFAALVGVFWLKPVARATHDVLSVSLSRYTGALLLTLFLALLIGMPMLLAAWPDHTLAVINAFYRAGSLVFGGGHVVLPLLQAATVPSHWLSNDVFLAGYGLAQAVPGPLFTFAAFLGASMSAQPNGWLGALICLLAIFLPSFLLIFGALPFWQALRQSRHTQAALAGVNAAVVGLLLAALYRPVWTSAIFTFMDFAWLLVALLALMRWRLPPWLVVAGCAVVGGLLGSSG